MIETPGFTKTYDFNFFFYLTCDSQRIGKLLAQYELKNKNCDKNVELVQRDITKNHLRILFK